MELSQFIPRYVLRAHRIRMQRSPLRQIVFAVVYEFAVFHTTPSTLSIIGALMIVSSAIYTTVIFPLSPRRSYAHARLAYKAESYH